MRMFAESAGNEWFECESRTPDSVGMYLEQMRYARTSVRMSLWATSVMLGVQLKATRAEAQGLDRELARLARPCELSGSQSV